MTTRSTRMQNANKFKQMTGMKWSVMLKDGRTMKKSGERTWQQVIMAGNTPMLLKAGLVKKSKVAEVAREQVRARHGKGPVEPGEIQREAERARAEKAERDRALAAARKVHPRTTYSLASVNYYRNGLRAKGVKVPSDREARRRRT